MLGERAAELPSEDAAPEVSVIIPTFHREEMVVEAVRSALDQRGVTVEVIVVDDSEEGSARGAIEGIADARTRYVKRAAPSGGNPCLVRNDGIALARGRFLHFLDDDDRLLDGALAALVSALDLRPRAGVAVGVVVPFGKDEQSLAHERAYFSRAAGRLRACRLRSQILSCLLFKEAPLVNSGSMIRSALARTIGGYDPEITYCEDAFLYLRAIRASAFVFVDRPVVEYRTGAPSRIHGGEEVARRIVLAYREIRERYRTAHGRTELLALRVFAGTIR